MVVLSLLGCGSERGTPTDSRDPAKYCIPGEQVTCACSAESNGISVCEQSRLFGPCDCGGEGGGGGQGPATQAQLLDAGTEKLVDVFVTPGGALVVTLRAVHLVDRTGAKLAEVTWPRDIHSAAYDGTHLVIGDAAKIATLDAALATVVEADVVETCESGLLFGSNRFVCGPGTSTDRTFRTYDALTDTELGASTPYTHLDIPARRVPGTDDFVTVDEGISPPDFHLYRLGADDIVAYINESPYHGDFEMLPIFGFYGSPASHLVTHEGLMLELTGENCNAEIDSFDTECFLKDGDVGTLSGTQIFLGLDSDASGGLYAFTAPKWQSASESACDDGCIAQHIDVANNTIVNQHLYQADVGEVIAARHDATAKALVVGFRLSGDYYFEDDPYPGYRVEILPYQ